MIVENIELSNFRNYERERFFFDSGINIIIGDNAQGKTNLLESIFYLTTAKSFRPGSDRDIVRFGASGFDLKANIYSAEPVSYTHLRLRPASSENHGGLQPAV